MSFEFTGPSSSIRDDLLALEQATTSVESNSPAHQPAVLKPAVVSDTASAVLPSLTVADLSLMRISADVPALPTKLDQLAGSVSKQLDNAGYEPDVQRKYRDHLQKFLKLESVTPAQKEATLAQIDRLLSHRGDSTVNSKHFPNIALQILKHAAEPNDINQGKHWTCQTVTMQEILFMRNPEKAAAVVVDGALTGTYTASDGVKTKVSADSLKPGKEEVAIYPGVEDRTHASQIFQVLVTNDITQRRSPAEEFVQTTEGGTDHDGGERLKVDGKFKIDPLSKKPFVHPDISVDELSSCVKRIFGDKVTMMTDKQDDLRPEAKAAREKRDLEMSKTPQAHLDYIIAPTCLDNLDLILGVADRIKDFPMMVRVDCRSKDFGGDETGKPIEHWVTIQSYDPKTKTVQISNQWGMDFDKKLTTERLYRALWRREWDY